MRTVLGCVALMFLFCPSQQNYYSQLKDIGRPASGVAAVTNGDEDGGLGRPSFRDTLLKLARMRIGAERPEVEDPMPRGKYAQA